MKTFKEIRNLQEGIKKITLDFDVGDPREFSPDWEEEGVFLVKWNKTKMEMTVEGEPKALMKWLTGTYGLSSAEAKKEMK
jgi:hypothetical protein